MRQRIACRIKHSKEENAGVAMIYVMIVGAVVLAFCLSMLLVTYTLFSQSSRQVTQMQCKLLAQTFSESLGMELKKPESELAKYLGKQIDTGYWVSEELQSSALEEGTERTSTTELVLNLDDTSIQNYSISVTLSYSLNLPEDDDGDESGNEEDDQDTETGMDGSGNESANTGQEEQDLHSNSEDMPETQAGNGTYCVKASIRCTRGDASDRDAQYYTIETEYPAVTFQEIDAEDEN